jgi:hypothetical protein
MRAELFAFLLAAVVPVLAQAAPAPLPQADLAASTAASAPGEAEAAGNAVDLERIRRELARPDTLRTQFGDDGRVVFRVEVEGQLPRFSDFIGRDESLVGPTPFGSMTHSDFVAMVTPPQARSFGAFTNGDLLQVLGTSLAAAFALNGAAKTVDAFRSWWAGREVSSARAEIKEVLDANERQRIEEAARQRAAEAEADRLAAIEAERKALVGGREPDLGPSITSGGAAADPATAGASSGAPPPKGTQEPPAPAPAKTTPPEPPKQPQSPRQPE